MYVEAKKTKSSLKGKLTNINTLAQASLIYVSTVTETPDRTILEINRIIQSYMGRSIKY